MEQIHSVSTTRRDLVCMSTATKKEPASHTASGQSCVHTPEEIERALVERREGKLISITAVLLIASAAAAWVLMAVGG